MQNIFSDHIAIILKVTQKLLENVLKIEFEYVDL